MITLRLEEADYQALLDLVRKYEPSNRLRFVLEDSTVPEEAE